MDYLPMGQFKGHHISEVPIQYIEYLANQDLSMWPSLKSTIEEMVDALDYEEQLQAEKENDGIQEYEDEFSDDTCTLSEKDFSPKELGNMTLPVSDIFAEEE